MHKTRRYDIYVFVYLCSLLKVFCRVGGWFPSPPSSNRTSGFPAYGFPMFFTLCIIAVSLSPKVKGSLEFSNFDVGVVSRVSPGIHSLLPPLIPMNKVWVLPSTRLCCPRFTGTMTLSDSLLAAYHFTLRAYRFALYDAVVRGRFP
jgi:hypothetical protein